LRAVYYSRISTQKEIQLSALKNQIEEAKQKIKSKGWELIDSYVDEGISGTSVEKRDEYNRLLRDIKTDKFDIVVVKSIDRMNRESTDWGLFTREIVRNNKKLYYYLDDRFYDLETKIIDNIYAEFAEQYSRDLSKKINNAHKHRQEKCTTVLITSATWGYDKVGKEVVVNIKEAEIVKLIYDLCIEGYGSRSISKELSKRGIRGRSGSAFAEITIRRIIRNPLFMGTVIMNKRHKNFNTKKTTKNPESEWIIHENAVIPIVSNEIWKEANRAMDTRSVEVKTDENKIKRIGKNKGKFDLSGKIFCGDCGSAYWRRYRKSVSGNQIIDWSCKEYIQRGRKNIKDIRGTKQLKVISENEGCDNIHIKEEDLNNILIEVSKKLFGKSKKTIINKTFSIFKSVLSQDTLEKDRIRVELDKKNIIIQKNLLMDKLLDGIISDTDYKNKDDELEMKLTNVIERETSLIEKKDKTINIEERIKSLENELESQGTDGANLIAIIQHIVKILIFTDRIEIYLDFYKPVFVGLNQDKSIKEIKSDYQYVDTGI